ncbi:MAG: indolepyruvate ferredoxin oxidoreductase, partial [Rhodospirillales bacterium]|nr:indolepyruvate ferredoxin oxidoreductase [Rhodospirillales bacterium]
MLGASINYPIRGAVTWKSTVGTNVASDALSNLASAGVKGGTLIILGEDYGEGASIIQERSHAFAMKSQIWLLDPRPNLPKLVEMVEKGFELSEVSSTPVMLEMRIRACHVYGQFDAKDNIAGKISTRTPLQEAEFDYGKICLPPSTYSQEADKITRRLPTALDFIEKGKLNETFGEAGKVGIILQGGLYNGVNRALEQLDLSDAYGAAKIPLYVLNVTYPLIPGEIENFCRDKMAVLVVEEGQPDFLAQAINSILRSTDIKTVVHGKNYLPMAGEYTGQVLFDGIARFLKEAPTPGLDKTILENIHNGHVEQLKKSSGVFRDPLPIRPPGFCTGCPER